MSDAELEQATEQWFLSRGLPMFIENYSAAEDIFTRAFPVLALVFFGTVAFTFSARYDGQEQAGATLGAAAVLVAAIVLGNVLRDQRPFARPQRVGRVELIGFVLVPPLVVWWLRDGRAALVMLVITGGTLLVVFVVTRYALVAALRWAIERVLTQLGDVYRIVTRALPLLLLFITFLFINTEVWQVAGSLDSWELWLGVAFFAGIAIAFLVARLPEELDQVETEATRDFVLASCADTPLAERAITLSGLEVKQPLARRQERNLMLVTLFTQLVQAAVVGIAVWCFFLAFGAVAIKESVQESWLGRPPDELVPLWTDHGVTRELFRVATFIGGFAGLYFTVYALTDSNYREQFLKDLLSDLGRVVGVRRAYLALRRERGLPPHTARDVGAPPESTPIQR